MIDIVHYIKKLNLNKYIENIPAHICKQVKCPEYPCFYGKKSKDTIDYNNQHNFKRLNSCTNKKCLILIKLITNNNTRPFIENYNEVFKK